MSHFCGQFTPEPEKYYQDLGLANDLDPKKGILSPFYLPKIGEPTELKSFQLGGSTVFLATPARVFSEEISHWTETSRCKAVLLSLKL